jgi:hypothetical protein
MNEQGKVMHLDDEDEGDSDSAPNEAELVAELRDFLDNVRPEDFNQ